MGAKLMVFFLNQDEQDLLFHSTVKIRPCLCDNDSPVLQIPLPVSSCLVWLKGRAHAEILVWVTAAVWFSFRGKNISLRQGAMWHWHVCNAVSFVAGLSIPPLLGAHIPGINEYLWKMELWYSTKRPWGDETSYVHIWLLIAHSKQNHNAGSPEGYQEYQFMVY